MTGVALVVVVDHTLRPCLVDSPLTGEEKYNYDAGVNIGSELY